MSDKQALVVVDMQNDFLLPSSPVCVAGGLACVPQVIRAVEVARTSSIPVIWVVRGHHPQGLDVERTRQSLFKDGGGVCVRGTEGAALIDGLAIAPGDIVVEKQRFSAFMGTELDHVLRSFGLACPTGAPPNQGPNMSSPRSRLRISKLIICGVQTPNCIRATAFDAAELDYEVSVLADGTASASAAVQTANLYDLRQIGVETPTVDNWAAGVGASATPQAAA